MDQAFFADNGYVRVPQVVPPERCEAVVQAVFDFLGFDPEDPEDWYRPPHNPGGMVELYQHQALWDVRQHPAVYEAFRALLGRDDLWVSIDRANLKPPVRDDQPDWDNKGFIHWDWNPTQRPIPNRVQGVIYLRDTDERMGGFRCVPGMHQEAKLDALLARQPEDQRDSRSPDLGDLEPIAVPGKQGDVVIWSVALLHGNGRNVSDKPRLAQYVSMYPARWDHEEQRRERVAMWQERRGPERGPFPGDPRHWEQQFPPAELTELGRKLLGAEPW